MFTLIAITCLIGAVSAAPYGELVGVPSYETVSVPHYSFNYAVNDPLTGDHKSQTETREAGVVTGSYSVAEPDGTLRVVDYTADPVSGFNAKVRRIGKAVHPQRIVAQVAHVAPVVTEVAAPVALHSASSYSNIGHAGLGHGLGIGGYSLGHNGVADLGYVNLSHLGYGGLNSYNLGHGYGH